MIATTTDSVEGRTVEAYLGIVRGVRVQSVTISAWLSSDGRPAAEESILDALAKATAEAVGQARALGADAVVGLQSDFEHYHGTQYVVVTGTAARLSKSRA